jgi:hypothetical protein
MPRRSSIGAAPGAKPRRSSIGATPGARQLRHSSEAAGGREPTPPAAQKVDLAKLEEELITEIADLSEVRLRKRAETDGVDMFDIVAAQGQEDPRESLKILIIERAKSLATSSGRTRQASAPADRLQPVKPGEPAPRIAPALFGVAQALEAPSGPKQGYEDLATNSTLREAERKYVPTNEGPGMRISPAEARRRAAEGTAAEGADDSSPAAGAAEGAVVMGVTVNGRYKAPAEGALARSRRVRVELEGLDISQLRARMEARAIPADRARMAEITTDPKAASELTSNRIL